MNFSTVGMIYFIDFERVSDSAKSRLRLSIFVFCNCKCFGSEDGGVRCGGAFHCAVALFTPPMSAAQYRVLYE